MLVQMSTSDSSLGLAPLSRPGEENIVSQTRKSEDKGRVCVSAGISHRLVSMSKKSLREGFLQLTMSNEAEQDLNPFLPKTKNQFIFPNKLGGDCHQIC